MHNFLEILSKPDNIPIVGMLLAIIFFLWVGLRQAFRHDRLIREVVRRVRAHVSVTDSHRAALGILVGAAAPTACPSA